MALGMKQWGAIALTGMATAAVLMLPPEDRLTPRLTGNESVDPASSRVVGLRTELEALNDALVRTRWIDSLETVMRRSGPSPNGVTVGWPAFGDDAASRLDARWAADLESAIRAEARARPADGSSQVEVGVFWVPAESGRHPASRRGGGSTGGEVYAGRLDGRPYCMVVQPFREGLSRRSLAARPGLRPRPGAAPWGGAQESTVGACDFWVRHGEPGEAVRRWLKAGAVRFALLRSTPDAERLGITVAYDLPFIGHGLDVDPSLLLASCLSGSDQACERTLFDPEVLVAETYRAYNARGTAGMEAIPAQYVGSAVVRLSTDFFMPALLANLEEQFGTEAFAEFWTSTEEPPEAFRRAFGLDPSEWLRSWTGPIVGGRLNGPRVRLATMGLLIPTLLGVLGVSAVVAGRRRVA